MFLLGSAPRYKDIGSRAGVGVFYLLKKTAKRNLTSRLYES